MLGIADERGQIGIERSSDGGRIDEILILERPQPSEAIGGDDRAAHMIGLVSAGTMQDRSEEQQRGAGWHFGGDRTCIARLRCRIVMAARPDQRRATLQRERIDRPDDVDLIVHPGLDAAPEILVAVRHLRERAGMDFDRLGEVENDTIAPFPEHRFGDTADDRVQHKAGDMP